MAQAEMPNGRSARGLVGSARRSSPAGAFFFKLPQTRIAPPDRTGRLPCAVIAVRVIGGAQYLTGAKRAPETGGREDDQPGAPLDAFNNKQISCQIANWAREFGRCR
jgi:hypothetical protein